MKIRFGFDIIYQLPAPTAMTVLLHTHPSVEPRLRAPEVLEVYPKVPTETYLDFFGNKATRLLAPAGNVRLTLDSLCEDSGELDPFEPTAEQWPVDALPVEVLTYLLPSRYCEVDRLGSLAWSLFGQTPMGWSRVQAVVDWVHHHLRFDYQQARATRTALDGYNEAVGVCRDFTHLAITLCRCLNIPARYATGYLGDIGVPAVPDPMDFSAWFEVFLGGRWYTFDARHNRRRIGRIVMAYGRDAADVALTTTFGPHTLQQFTIWTDEVVAPTTNALPVAC
ncbi:MAG TPA: transglutaminase family protein [Opitutaceae bacterium]|nr:transglutaminase family protein [Opitutaceae bacterium]